MLTTTDDRVLAQINVHAVLGALPQLAERSDRARHILASMKKPVTLTLSAPGNITAQYTFSAQGIRLGAGGAGARLQFLNAAHLNAVIAGTKKPIPLAGPTGLKFLTSVFEPLSGLLGRYLEPEAADLEDPEFAKLSTILTLEVVATALTVIANEDESGRFTASHMPDGTMDLEVGDDLSFRVKVSSHRLAREATVTGTPRAALRFTDLTVASDVLSGRTSAVNCVGDGRIQMRGFIPLVDNTSRLLDRVDTYLGA